MSKIVVGDTCVPSLTVINTAINQLETNVLIISVYCLKIFVVDDKDEML